MTTNGGKNQQRVGKAKYQRDIQSMKTQTTTENVTHLFGFSRLGGTAPGGSANADGNGNANGNGNAHTRARVVGRRGEKRRRRR